MALQNYAIEPMKTFTSERYAIPNYQREYAWEDDEVSDFISDLEEIKGRTDSMHFFGQIVVHNDETANKKYIIDGQQRTITSMIYLRVLQIFYSHLYLNTKYKPAEKKDVLLSSFIGEYSDEEKSLHLTLGTSDNDFFVQNIILAEEPSDKKAKKKSWERMRKAFKRIYEHVKAEYCAVNDTVEKMKCLNQFFDAFTENFKVMYMEATKLEEAFIIFETLNARGKDLETADLLKNFIFSKSQDISEAQKKWNSMITKLDKVDPTNYIRHYWNSSNEFTREKALYRAIVQQVKKPKDAKDLVDDLDKFAQCYHDMAFPEDNNDFTDVKLVKSLKNLKILKARTFYPVILAMKQAKENYTDADIRIVAEKIETYVFRNFTICGKVAGAGERFLADVALRIYDDLTNVDLICKEINKGIIGDKEFQAAFEVWSSTNREIIRYILRKLDKYIAPTEELSIDNNDIHIEHIMPVDNTKWQVPEELHSEYLWRLGNLTLLSGTINKSISNDVFPVKVSEYTGSKIELNKMLHTMEDGSQRSAWNVPDDIENRQKKFAEQAVKIWKKN